VYSVNKVYNVNSVYRYQKQNGARKYTSDCTRSLVTDEDRSAKSGPCKLARLEFYGLD